MKKLLLILLLASPVVAAQKYGFSDPKLEDEFVNNYKEHDFPKWINATGSTATIKYINVSTITLNGVNLGASSPSKVVNVYWSSGSATTSTTTTAYAITALAKTVTLTSATNNFIVYAVGSLSSTDMHNNAVSSAALFRDATNVTQGTTAVGIVKSQCIIEGGVTGSVGALLGFPCALQALDAPGDTSAHTYSVKISAVDASGTTAWNRVSANTYMIILETLP